MTDIADIPAPAKQSMVRKSHYAVLVLNLAVIVVIAAMVFLNDRRNTEQWKLIATYHSVAIHDAQDARQELNHFEHDIGSIAVIDPKPKPGDAGAEGGKRQILPLTDRINNLAIFQQDIVDLQRQFARPRFREITSLTDGAFTAFFKAWKPPNSERPDPVAWEALALLDLRLEQLVHMHIIAAERSTEVDDLVFAIGEKTLLALFLGLMAVAAYVSFGIVRRLDIVGKQREVALAGLANSEAQLDTFFAMAPLGMCLFDRDLRYIKVNKGLADINGLTISENLGKTPREILPADVADLIETAARRCIATGEELINADSIRVYPETPDRPHYRMLSVFPVGDAGGGEGNVGMTVVDVTDIKEVENALRDSEARLEAFFTEAPAGLAILGRDYRYLRLNETLAQINRLSVEDHLGRRPTEILPDPVGRDFEAIMDRTFKGGETLINEQVSADTPDGPRHWVFSQFPVSASPGRPDALGLVVVDMTEQRAAEQQLQHLAESLTKAQRIARLGSWSWEIADGTLSWSDEMYRIAGLDRETTPTVERFMQAVHPEDRVRVRDAEGRALANGQPYSLEFRLIRPDGEIRTLSEQVEVEFDADGEPAVMRGTDRDVTEKKQTDQKLRESEARLNAFFTKAPVGLGIRDRECRYIKVNETLARGNGVSVETQIGKRPSDFMAPEKAEVIQNLTRRTLDHGESIDREEIVVPGWDGQDRYRIYTQFPLSGDPEKPDTVGFVVVDVTERKRIERELAQLNAELEERVEERTVDLRAAQEELVKSERLATMGQLTATVSHELRNPLGAMRTSMYVVERKIGTGDQRLQKAIDRVNRNITRCDQIIDELLDFTRIRDLDLRPTDIDEWLGAVMDEQNLPDGIAVKRKFAVPGVRVPIDSDRLRRAFVNTIENACQAVADPHQEGAIPRRPVVTVETRLKKDRLEITISDNGPGVPPENHAKIFEPLFSTRNFGVGLGLPTVKQIMEHHGGGVEIGDRRGGGAKFALWLPLAAILENENA